MPRTAQRAALLLLTATSVFAGCARNLLVTDGAESVQVRDIRASFTPGDRGDFELDLTVENPGLPSGALTGLQWEIWLGNRWFAAGTKALAEPLPYGGKREFTVQLPVVFRRSAPAQEEPRALDVSLRGAVIVQAGGGTQRFPFEAHRMVEARHAPQWTQEADEL